MKDFTRNELIELREVAKEQANCPHLNEDWKRAYLALADAADHLDAMIARCTIRVEAEDQIEVKEVKEI